MKFNSKWSHIEHKNQRNNITVEKSKTYITNKARRFPFRFKTFDLECYKPTLNTNKTELLSPKLVFCHLLKMFKNYQCSKCCTLKTLPRTVSVQVQPISYKCQPGHKLFSEQCQANGHELIGSECHTGTQSQLSNKLLINRCQITRQNLSSYVSTIEDYLALSVTQGHNRNYQTSS